MVTSIRSLVIRIPLPVGLGRSLNRLESRGAVMDHPALDPGTTLSRGRYRLGPVIGGGGYGIVYRARDTRLRRDIVVKELFPPGVERLASGSVEITGPAWMRDEFALWLDDFIEEGIFLARIAHPCVVKLFDVVEQNGTGYLILEHVQGESLEELHRQDRITEELLERWMSRIVDAVAQIHKQGILHLDLKPGNILITFTGQPVIIDFGSAKIEGKKSQQYACTRDYAAPEVFMGRSQDIGRGSDIFSLAVIVHEILTGDLPPINSIHPDLPERWVHLVQKGLEQDPSQRTNKVRLWWTLLERGQKRKRFLVEAAGEVYHTMKRCPDIEGKELRRLTTVEGLNPCPTCGSPHLQAPAGCYFVTVGGPFYHRSRGCTRLNWHPGSPNMVYEVKGRKPCDLCVPKEEKGLDGNA